MNDLRMNTDFWHAVCPHSMGAFDPKKKFFVDFQEKKAACVTSLSLNII